MTTNPSTIILFYVFAYIMLCTHIYEDSSPLPLMYEDKFLQFFSSSS